MIKGILAITIVIIAVVSIFFLTIFIFNGISNSAAYSSCKQFYFPSKSSIDECVVKQACKRNCDTDFKGFLCADECKNFTWW
jgi:hypothetical protein